MGVRSIVFIVANVCIAASFVFYDSLLPHIARPDEMDRVSTAAYAMGYLGGGLLLVINLLWILMPTNFGIPDTITAIRLSFVSVAIWWLVFSIRCFATCASRTGARTGRDWRRESRARSVRAPQRRFRSSAATDRRF